MSASGPCPDNALRLADGTTALLDFEFARPGHALFDATWWHMGFPSCWCAGALPERLVARADARYRETLAPVVGAWLDAVRRRGEGVEPLPPYPPWRGCAPDPTATTATTI